MNLKHTFIAALLLISTASHAAAPAQRLSTPKKYALASLYMVGSAAAGLGGTFKIQQDLKWYLPFMFGDAGLKYLSNRKKKVFTDISVNGSSLILSWILFKKAQEVLKS